ncbi:MAG: ATP-binding cassette domain-containing protein [Nitrospiraceae bacterium]|nr:ATP-binding cassette domain-containing protein [Nitrospiraceae bacterium]
MGKSPVVKGMDPVISVREFTKDYKSVRAVRGVSFDVMPGEIYGLIGPDGAGKSSLLKAAAGVLSYNGGQIRVFGGIVCSERAAERIKPRIGFMPQGLGLNLYPELSVEENIDFFARLMLVSRAALAERKERLLAITRLERFRQRRVRHLSGGMRQKLGLACTLIHEPELLILDEPTTGVDPVSRRDFWAILAELLQGGRTALISTSYMDEASRFYRMSMLYEGRIIAGGEPSDVLKTVPGSIVSLRCDDPERAAGRLKAVFRQAAVFGREVRVFAKGASPDEAAARVSGALSGLDVKDIRCSEPELEDVFIAIMQEKGFLQTEGPAMPPVPRGEQAARRAISSGIAIEARNLVRDFGSFRAVDNVSFQVRQGEIFGLLGANGAGKTTVIKMLTGIMPPTSGMGWVAGADMRRAGREIRENIGYMSQFFSLYNDLTVAENIRLYAGIYGLSARRARSRAEWILQMAGLRGYESSLAGRMPVGMRQRLALGCSLVHSPAILFLDEPTSGVDPVGRRHFWDILFTLANREGVAILVTTHYMLEAGHCGRLALMHAGRIIADAPPRDLRLAVQEKAGPVLELEVEDPFRALELIKGAGLTGAALWGRRIHILSRDPELALSRSRRALLPPGLKILGYSVRPPDTEDVFVYHVLAMEGREKAA